MTTESTGETRDPRHPRHPRDAPANGPVIVAAGVLFRRFADGERVLLTQRRPGAHLAGTWELPGGKLNAGEDPRACVARELYEEIGVEVDVGEPLEVTSFSYPGKQVLLLFFEVTLRAGSGEPRAIEVADWVWADADGVESAEMPPADAAIAKRIVARLRG